MAGKDRYLQERNGRFYARLVIPEGLRPYLDNKTELRTPLGADRRAAVTQLRKQDVRQDGELWVIRITPDAGTVKAGGFRDVPLHPQLIDMGFADFVETSPSGPLFHRTSSASGALRAARTVSGRISTWLGTLKIVPDGVSPSHGWRHRFKTVGRDLGSSDRVLDAICGHVGKTAGDNYGDVTVTAKARVIQSFPRYAVKAA